MCQVLIRQYKGCKHEFHQNEKPCREFIVELQKKANKDRSAKDFQCRSHACSGVELVNEATIRRQKKPRLVPITRVGDLSKLDGVGWWGGWSPSKSCDHPRVVEGHCAGEHYELKFVHEGSPIPHETECGGCQAKKGSGWLARWVRR